VDLREQSGVAAYRDVQVRDRKAASVECTGKPGYGVKVEYFRIGFSQIYICALGKNSVCDVVISVIKNVADIEKMARRVDGKSRAK